MREKQHMLSEINLNKMIYFNIIKKSKDVWLFY